MPLTVTEIAKKMEGRVEGDGDVVISGMAGLEDGKTGDISFLSNPRYSSYLATTKVSAVVVNEDWSGVSPCSIIRVKNADAAFAVVASMLCPPSVVPGPGIHPSAVIASDVKLGTDVSIGPYCMIEKGVRVGDRTILFTGCYLGQGTIVGKDCRLYPRVSTREYTKIGDRVIIHNGAVIGSDGFGYSKDGKVWKKIPQVGIVEIGNDVEIGANVTIDRARFGKTVVGNGVKIDNLVQIAHNVKIGENTAMAAQVGVSGSTIIGSNVQFGGQAGISGHLHIGDNSVVGAQAGVTKDVKSCTFVSGYPAMEHDKAIKLHAHMARLPVLKKKIEEMEKRLSELEERIGKGLK
ncbi:MAG: UDP-3-O-(3-hydroxymyristoyl)glucosamine N-acyltransferase [Kiritimatiellae bacterium]|nr:UDP-3-O-(3-hydroxymyristoyl)glucosamine N-acyltransferase [Kiritimatiellia bacterium]MDD5522143.1 UDP-3-O-(3-hydroxymyristoyl)glucosamine N-acyltransferase [Kiritimatiellia bacterium]